MKKSLIFLTGFMGSGKSTVGPILAEKIGYDFIDVDELIEKVEGTKHS
jgi:shikimate kinase